MSKLKIEPFSEEKNLSIDSHLIPLIDYLKSKGGIPVSGNWRSEPNAMVFNFKTLIDFDLLMQEVELPKTIQLMPKSQTIFDESIGWYIIGAQCE